MIIIFIYHIEKSREELVVFFLIMKQKNWIKNFQFVRELGLAFIDISKKLINRKKKLQWTKKIKKSSYGKEEDMLSLIFCMIEVQNLD